MSTDNDIPRPYKVLQVFWPIVAMALVGGTYAVTAMAQADNMSDRVSELEQNGTPIVRERLARIETSQSAQGKQLERIEDKLDEVLHVKR